MTSPPTSKSDQRAGGEADPFRGTPYRVVRLLGSNDFRESFVVAHRVTGRQFFARLQAASLVGNHEATERMRIEAQVLGSLNHANTVTALSAGYTADSRFYLVTEYLEGRSLTEELEERGQIPFREAIAWTCDLLSALSAAHALGIVHRGVSPNSLMVCADSSRRYLKLTSFRGARVLPDAPEGAPAPLNPATDPNLILGVPLFVCPELVARGTTDTRSDIYSAGLLLYVMIAGGGPFDHLPTALEILTAQVLAEIPPLSEFAGVQLPHELDGVIAKALMRDPSARFQSATEFIAALEQVLLDAVEDTADEDGSLAPAVGSEPDPQQVSREAARDATCVGSESAVSAAQQDSRPRAERALSNGLSPAGRRFVALATLFVVTAVITAIIVRSARLLLASPRIMTETGGRSI